MSTVIFQGNLRGEKGDPGTTEYDNLRQIPIINLDLNPDEDEDSRLEYYMCSKNYSGETDSGIIKIDEKNCLGCGCFRVNSKTTLCTNPVNLEEGDEIETYALLPGTIIIVSRYTADQIFYAHVITGKNTLFLTSEGTKDNLSRRSVICGEDLKEKMTSEEATSKTSTLSSKGIYDFVESELSWKPIV